MARGELMKKLLASYGRDDEFRAVAEQIILEEEQKNNRVLARTLRKTLDNAQAAPARPKALAPLIPFPDAASDFVERIEPEHNKNDIVLSDENVRVFVDLMHEFRRGDEIRRRGLTVRSKLLFCGPPGCGKTLCAEVFAAELGLPLSNQGSASNATTFQARQGRSQGPNPGLAQYIGIPNWSTMVRACRGRSRARRPSVQRRFWAAHEIMAFGEVLHIGRRGCLGRKLICSSLAEVRAASGRHGSRPAMAPGS
jgi:hypothetical protein